jgi:hypothetical protein
MARVALLLPAALLGMIFGCANATEDEGAPKPTTSPKQDPAPAPAEQKPVPPPAPEMPFGIEVQAGAAPKAILNVQSAAMAPTDRGPVFFVDSVIGGRESLTLWIPEATGPGLYRCGTRGQVWYRTTEPKKFFLADSHHPSSRCEFEILKFGGPGQIVEGKFEATTVDYDDPSAPPLGVRGTFKLTRGTDFP